MSSPKIAILIVGYQSKSHLINCLASLSQSTYQNFTVFYLDNSNDDSVAWVKKHHPKVVTFGDQGNLGFAGGNNFLIQKAAKAGFKHFFLLNPDTLADPTALTDLVSHLDDAPILQPVVLISQQGRQTDLINTAGNVIHYLGYSYCGSYKKKLADLDRQPRPITVASGAAVLINQEVVEKIGYLDEDFFMYHEDADYFWRARLYGLKLLLIPTAKIYHEYSFSRNDRKFFYAERNRLYFLAKNWANWTLVAIGPMFIVNEILMFIYAFLSGSGGAKVRSYAAFFRAWPELKKKRQQLQQTRKVGDAALKKFFISQLDFAEVRVPGLSIYNWVMALYWQIIRGLI